MKKCDIQKLVKLHSERVGKSEQGNSEVLKFRSLVLLDSEVVPFMNCNKCLTVSS